MRCALKVSAEKRKRHTSFIGHSTRVAAARGGSGVRGAGIVSMKTACVVSVTTTCPGSPEVQALCAQAKSRPLLRVEMQQVASTRELGCRNPLGLDHIAIGRELRADDATKVALGVRGRTLAATDTKPEPLLGVSDHCPLVTRLQW